ncbi:hypothetical protein [Capnocytophaga cynodegmi]|nr:hypothetical protein [Capnocytophaga cynodegmi]
MEKIKFQPLENITLVDRIEKHIIEHIKENKLKPGMFFQKK